MSSTPSQVVAALAGLLGVKAIVELEEVDALPDAVVTDASDGPTKVADDTAVLGLRRRL